MRLLRAFPTILMLGVRGLAVRLLRRPTPPSVTNVNRAKRASHPRSALLVYLPRAFGPDADERLLTHQNLLCCREMAAALHELGYVVDVVDRRDREFWPRRDYDLIVSERMDWNGIERLFPSGATQVYLATSLCHTLHNRNVRRRHELLEGRGRPPIEIRRVYSEILPAVQAADAVVGVGNRFTMGTWSEVYDGPIHAFDNFAFPGTRSVIDGKDFEAARRRFLFFASRSQIQKGLDLLLEVFPKHPELELYVCSQFEQEPDFCSAYERELFRSPNVHPIGMVPATGEQFYDLARRCAYVIHPSCSDGQAGAVVQCMGAGLIPVVTRETGVDVDGFGVELASDDIGDLERVILDLAERPPDWHREQGMRTRHAVDERFTVEAFAVRWREILAEIVGTGHSLSRGDGSR